VRVRIGRKIQTETLPNAGGTTPERSRNVSALWKKSRREESKMAWHVGKVQNTTIGTDFPIQPGFTVQRYGHSPSLTVTFEDEKTAKECKTLMETIVEKASAMRGHD
jgi:hypothetical protein